VPLEPYDNVLIFKQPEFELQRTVTIEGEVYYPGTYALNSKGDRLADLVHRAGGLTPRAYTDGVRFYRPLDGAGRINIDLPKALRDNRARDNVIMQPGDKVVIPEYIPSVKVFGALNAPGSVLYKKGAGLATTSTRRGGFAYNADKGRTSVPVCRWRGACAAASSCSFAAIPRRDPGRKSQCPSGHVESTNYVALVGAIAQILASTVAIIVVARRL